MNLGAVLLIVLIVLLLGGGGYYLPHWSHSQERGLGWGPSGGLGTLALVVFLLWLFFGRG